MLRVEVAAGSRRKEDPGGKSVERAAGSTGKAATGGGAARTAAGMGEGVAGVITMTAGRQDRGPVRARVVDGNGSQLSYHQSSKFTVPVCTFFVLFWFMDDVKAQATPAGGRDCTRYLCCAEHTQARVCVRLCGKCCDSTLCRRGLRIGCLIFERQR